MLPARDLNIVFIMKKIFSVLLSLFVIPMCALANDSIGVTLGVGASATTGLNAIVGYRNTTYDSKWLSRFGVRLDVATTDPLKSAIDSAIDRIMRDGISVGNGVKIDNGKLNAWHGALLLDYYPFGGAWRLTGGYAWGGMELESDIYGTVENAPSKRFYFYLAGDHYYYNGNSFSGSTKTDWDFYGPYLGMGFDWDIWCGFVVYLDAGVVLTNRPARISINVPHQQLYIYNKENDTWSAVTIAALDNDIATATADANRKLADNRIYPALKLGFLYRF